MIGETLSHYKIVDKLGAGGMGEVYLAEDTTLKRRVALKVLPPDLAASQERLERFQREAETLASLDHPNIVTVFTVQREGDVHFLTMQLIEGEQLSELIPEGGMPLEKIFEIAIPLADALATAHEKGVIHRDLKPPNIMVTDEGRVKVLDFGLAKLRREVEAPLATQLPTESLTGEGRIVGTIPYMSPEQLEGKEVDARSDLFSLGVILYEMATGDLPFQGDTSVSLMSSIVKDSPEPPGTRRPDLPHHLGRIIQRCLEKEPTHRYQTMRDAVLELSNLQREIESSMSSGVAVQAEPIEGTRSRRGTWVWALLTTAALLLGAITIWKLADWPFGPQAEESRLEAQAREEISNPRARLLHEQAMEYFDAAETAAQWDLAATAMRRSLELEPDNAWLKAELGQVLVGRQSSDPRAEIREEALELAAQAIAADPEIVGAWLVRGKLAQLEGDHQAAVEAGRKISAIDPRDHRGAYLLGRALIKQGSKEEGLAEIRRGAELDDDPISAHFNVGYGLQSLGRLDDAILEYKHVIELAPGHGNALNNLAVIYFWMGRYLEAVPLFRRLTEIRPEDTSAANNLGTLYYYLDRMEEAIEAYLLAERLSPASAMIKNNLGDAYAKLGEREQAEAWYRKAIVAADEGLAGGGDRLELQTLKFLCVAKVGRFDEATTGIETLVADHPAAFEVLYTAAQVSALAGNRDRLLEYTERAIRAGYPREEFVRAPEFASFQNDATFQELLFSEVESQ